MIQLGVATMEFDHVLQPSSGGVFTLQRQQVDPFNLLLREVATMTSVRYWSADGTADLTVDGSGDTARMVVTATGTSLYAYTRTQPAYPGVYYRAGLDLTAATTGRDCEAKVDFRDANGALLSSSTGATVNDATTVRPTVEAQAPAGTVVVSLVFLIDGTTSGEVHYADNAMLRPTGTA